jgi:hypothetical protein
MKNVSYCALLVREVAKPFYSFLNQRTPQVLWVSKIRILRHFGQGLFKCSSLKYVLFSKERDTFTYNLENYESLANELATYFGTTPAHQFFFIQELVEGIRCGESKTYNIRRSRIGRHLLIYCVIRNVQPDLVIELGCKDGLGSLCILFALEKNSKGVLESVDIDPNSGKLLSGITSLRLQHTISDSIDFLKSFSGTFENVLAISDSVCDDSHIKKEYELASKIAKKIFYFQHNLGWSNLLPSRGPESKVLFFQEVSDHFFYGGRGSYIGEKRHDGK